VGTICLIGKMDAELLNTQKNLDMKVVGKMTGDTGLVFIIIKMETFMAVNGVIINATAKGLIDIQKL